MDFKNFIPCKIAGYFTVKFRGSPAFLPSFICVTIETTCCVVTVHHVAFWCTFKKARQKPEDTTPIYSEWPQENSH